MDIISQKFHLAIAFSLLCKTFLLKKDCDRIAKTRKDQIQMKIWLSEHKHDNAVSIIVSVITAFVMKVGEWTFLMASSAGSSILQALQNLICYQAGRQGSSTIANGLLSIIIGVLFAAALNVIIGGYRAVNPSAPKKMSTGHRPVSRRQMNCCLTIALVLIVCMLLWICVNFLIPSSMQHEFELRITQITPYIDEAEIHLLQSKWVSMCTKSDYDQIDAYIHTIRMEHQLP